MGYKMFAAWLSLLQKLFINFSKTVEEFVLIVSIQYYFDYKSSHRFIYPKHHDFWYENVCHSLYYSTEYDDDYDDENGFYEFAETIQNDRAEFFFVIIIRVELMVC